MTPTFRAHFDGKVFVPDEPVDIRANQSVILRVDSVLPSDSPKGIPIDELGDLLGRFTPEEAKEMMRVIDEEFGQVEADNER